MHKKRTAFSASLVGIAKHLYIHARKDSPLRGLLHASCIYYYEIGDFNEC